MWKNAGQLEHQGVRLLWLEELLEAATSRLTEVHHRLRVLKGTRGLLSVCGICACLRTRTRIEAAIAGSTASDGLGLKVGDRIGSGRRA